MAAERVEIGRAAAELALRSAQVPGTAPADVARLLATALEALKLEENLARGESERRLERRLRRAPSAEAAVREMSKSTATKSATVDAAHLRMQVGDSKRSRLAAQRAAHEAYLEECRQASILAGRPFTAAEISGRPPPPTTAQSAAALRATAITPEMLRAGLAAGAAIEKAASGAEHGPTAPSHRPPTADEVAASSAQLEDYARRTPFPRD